MTATFRSILVPYDGSEPAHGALALALALAHPDATITVLTVVDESPIIAQSATTVVAYDPTELFEALDTEGQAIQADAQARCASAHVVPVTQIVHDTPVAGILAAANEHASDLIVMGTHARSGLARTFLGSTTEGVLRAAEVPVLTTRAGESTGDPFATALVAIDDSDASDGAVAVAANLLRARGTHLVAVNATNSERLMENAATYGFDPGPLERDAQRGSAGVIARALAQAKIPTETVGVALVDGQPVPAILAAAHEHHATVIVIGSHGRGGLEHLFLGSVAEAVVRESPVPVLVVRRGLV